MNNRKPKTSKTWGFQENHWNFQEYNGKETYKNDTYYSSYDSSFSLKPLFLNQTLN